VRSHPAELDRASPLPLWAQLEADLRRRLAAGCFTAGFPGELTLVQDYLVSRQTVREALRRLRADGVVVAERGRPPRIAVAAQLDQPLGALYSLFSSVEARGQEQRSKVLRLRIGRNAAVAARLGLESSTDLLHLERLRLAAGEPLALDRVWLPADLAGALIDSDFTHTSLYEELARRCGVRLQGGQERIAAVLPSATQRRLLHIDEGTALLAIERTACMGGRPVEWRETLVRADRFTLSVAFTPGIATHAALAGVHHPAPTSRP
jgi:GntR family transcriptional regulator